MAPGSIIPIIVAAQQAKIRRALEAFRTVGATAPERARPLAALGLERSDIFADMVDAGVIRPGPSPDTYYLDEVAHAAQARRQGRGMQRVLVALLLLVLAGLVVLMFVRPTII